VASFVVIMIVRFDVSNEFGWKIFQIRKIFILLVCGKLSRCENVRCVGQNLDGIAIGLGHLAVDKAALPSKCSFVITGVIGREEKCDAALHFFINCSIGWLLLFNLARRRG
jgi:hypothetical protein